MLARIKRRILCISARVNDQEAQTARQDSDSLDRSPRSATAAPSAARPLRTPQDKLARTLRRARAQQAEQPACYGGRRPISARDLQARTRCGFEIEGGDDGLQAIEPQMETRAMGPYTVGSAHERGRRPTMEDASGVAWSTAANAGVAAVFDGHGGDAVAVFAAERLPQKIFAGLEQLSPEQRRDATAVAATLKNAFAAPESAQHKDGSAKAQPRLLPLHDEVTDLLRVPAKGEPRFKHDGATAIAAVFLDDAIFIANVGDSRALLIDESGTATRLSVDHKPQDEIDKIEARGGMVTGPAFRGCHRVNGSLAVARALGDLHHPIGRRPQISRLEAGQQGAGNRLLLLACDGIFDVLTDAVVANFVSEQARVGRSSAHIAADLVRAAHARRSMDNLTALLIAL